MLTSMGTMISTGSANVWPEGSILTMPPAGTKTFPLGSLA
jgi:hypothetical protein